METEGAAHLVLAEGVTALHPQEYVFEAMLSGWTAQQTSRLLKAQTICSRERVVRAFQRFTNDYPWNWAPADIEEWTVLLVSGKRRANSTLRSYHNAIAMFCGYLVDQRYGWEEECTTRFGTHPVQICHEWNTAAHVADYEGRPENRPLTRQELQDFFDHSDAEVEGIRSLKRKGWLAAFRDAALFKLIYAWGLRRREAAMLDVTDFTSNPKAPEFSSFGVLSVRYGKSLKGSAPRRRNVLTVMPWSVEVVDEYLTEIRPRFGFEHHPAIWLTERGGRIDGRYINTRFASYRDELGLPEELSPHCLRHSYVTHLVEDGFDPHSSSSSRWDTPTPQPPPFTPACRPITRTRS